MPAHPPKPDPLEAPLQVFAYGLRELGEGKISVGRIADAAPWVSRAALYATMSGTRLPQERTVSTLLRWWAGDPAIERPIDEEALRSWWDWIDRLPENHEKRRLANEWRNRYQQLVKDNLRERKTRPRATRVNIAVPPEQHRFIKELTDLIEQTGRAKELWRLFEDDTPYVERYLAGKTLPTDRMLHVLAHHLREPRNLESFMYYRLKTAVKLARLARARDRRTAREQRSEIAQTPE